ncbi:ricin-type beta-trefoil lectin domain protein, partial [Streptomyces cyaneofuscatus]
MTDTPPPRPGILGRLHRLRRLALPGLSLIAMAAFLSPGAPANAVEIAAVGQITGIGGKCVDVAGASSANGTAVQLYDCNGTGAQQWDVRSDGTVRALGKCLDAKDGATANGTLVQLWDCNGTAAQR